MAESSQYTLQLQTDASRKVAEMNLTEEQLAQYRRKFNVFDLNKDGVISLREFASVSKVFGYHLTQEEILELFNRRDLDESGGISFEEFIIAMRSRASQQAAEPNVGKMREIFKLYDVKKRGYVTADQAYPILKQELGFDLSKTEALVDMYDKNRDYRLSLFEFVEFYKRVEQLKEEIVDAFQQFDTNHDGFVDLGEAISLMAPKGVTPQQVEALFRKADENQDGRLDYSEFAAFWDVSIV